MRQTITAVILGLMASLAYGELQTQTVEYTSGSDNLKGYLAYDDAFQGPRPGILVVHEWWGQNEYARRRARMLAELGYTALALDMYGDGKVAEHPKDAGAFSAAAKATSEAARERFKAALEFLRAQPTTDPDKIGAIGYCFGGGVVLQMARDGVDLDGVVSFHGSLQTDRPAREGAVRAHILVCCGEADQFAPKEQRDALKAEMEAAGVDFQMKTYEGAQHSFTNPDADAFAERFGLPLGYNATADRESWEAMQAFFTRVFSE